MKTAAMTPLTHALVAGFWGAAMFALAISAIRLCYAVEARSRGAAARRGLPVYANLLGVAFNFGVAQDEETQRMRKRMNLRLILFVVGLVASAVIVNKVIL
jgi:hypothetical protein